MRKPSRRSLGRLRIRGSKNRSLQQRGGRRSKAIRQRRGDGAGSSKQGMALGAANGAAGAEPMEEGTISTAPGEGIREFAGVSMDCRVWQVAPSWGGFALPVWCG